MSAMQGICSNELGPHTPIYEIFLVFSCTVLLVTVQQHGNWLAPVHAFIVVYVGHTSIHKFDAFAGPCDVDDQRA